MGAEDWAETGTADKAYQRHAGRNKFAAISISLGRRMALDDIEAWSLIDAALPPERRGDLTKNYLAPYAAPAPVRLGRDELSRYASGAEISLIGARDGHGWTRIKISFARRFDGA